MDRAGRMAHPIPQPIPFSTGRLNARQILPQGVLPGALISLYAPCIAPPAIPSLPAMRPGRF